MEGLEDFSKICRLCLQGGEVMCPIFASGRHNNGTAALPYRIMSCARVKLVEGDGLPSNVCTNCLAQVDRSYQFKVLCERSELTLRGGIKADSSTDTESLDGGESWDMTKFTPEVIIKEEADEGTVENGLPTPIQQLEPYLSHHHHHHHHHHPHHSIYPFTQMEELLRNHGTEIKVQAEQHPGGHTTNGGSIVPVTLGQPAALLVAHRLVPVMNHQQGGASPGGPATTTAVLVATTAPPPPAPQQQQHQQHFQPQHQTSQQPKVTLLATTVPVATGAPPPPLPSPQPQQQKQQHNGSALQNNLQHQKQKQQYQQQNEMLHHHGTLELGSLSSKSRRCRGGDKLFKCSQCNKSYSFSSALSRHKAVHNKELRPHVCKICNKGFTHSDKLLRHQKTHTMDVFINCDVCKKPFKSYPAYQKHKQSSNCEGAPTTNDNGGNWCETCNVELDTDKSHVCNGSDSMATAGDSSSKQPIPTGENSPNREHPADADEDPSERSSPPASPPPNSRRTKGKSDFKCKVCLKYFATKGSLEVHSTIHTGVRPFVCSACGKSFRHKVNLMEHFQRKHSQVRPYICDVCAARFVTKQELVRHYRKHIGD